MGRSKSANPRPRPLRNPGRISDTPTVDIRTEIEAQSTSLASMSSSQSNHSDKNPGRYSDIPIEDIKTKLEDQYFSRSSIPPSQSYQSEYEVSSELPGQAHAPQVGGPCSLLNKLAALRSNALSTQFTSKQRACDTISSESDLSSSDMSLTPYVTATNLSSKEIQDSTPSLQHHEGLSKSNWDVKLQSTKINSNGQHLEKTRIQNGESSSKSPTSDSTSFDAARGSRRSPGDASRIVPGLGRAELIRRFKKI